MNEIEDILREELERLKSDIGDALRRNDKVVTGKTLRSLSVEVNGKNGALWGADYIQNVKRGRRPRQSTEESDFLQNLKQWIVARHIPVKDNKDLDRLARFFRWYINKYGSKAWREGKEYDIYDTAIREFEERLEKRIIAIYENQITKDILL